MKRAAGFTILELLVATAVLGLILVAVLEITGKTGLVARFAGSKIEASQSVRTALDSIASDLSGVVLSPRATILVRTGSYEMAFLTRRRGPNNVPTRFLAVCYRLSSEGRLLRSYAPVDWTKTNLLAGAESAAVISDPPEIAENILNIVAIAVLEDGTRVPLENPPPGAWIASGTVPYGEWSVPTGWTALVFRLPSMTPITPRVRALEIAIIGTDIRTYRALSSAQRALFTLSNSATPVQDWENTLQTAALPQGTAFSIQQKSIPFP